MAPWRRTSWLDRRDLVVDGLLRGYWLGPTHAGPRPLLLALHGFGASGRDLEASTGLAARGSRRGAVVVLPDAWQQVWDVRRVAPNERAVDDGAFLAALVARLRADGVASDDPPFVVGISNGALMAERVARERLLEVRGVALVAGTTRATTRASCPDPRQRAEVVLVAGTADTAMPYVGGPIQPWRRPVGHPAPTGDDPQARVVSGVELVAGDWVRANGLPDAPAEVRRAGRRGHDVTVRRWTGPSPPGVTLYRVEGGGHTWPGGPRRNPLALVGRITADLDATGVVLDAAEASTGGARTDAPRGDR